MSVDSCLTHGDGGWVKATWVEKIPVEFDNPLVEAIWAGIRPVEFNSKFEMVALPPPQ